MMHTTQAELIERLGYMPVANHNPWLSVRLYRAFGAINFTLKVNGKAMVRLQVWGCR